MANANLTSLLDALPSLVAGIDLRKDEGAYGRHCATNSATHGSDNVTAQYYQPFSKTGPPMEDTFLRRCCGPTGRGYLAEQVRTGTFSKGCTLTDEYGTH